MARKRKPPIRWTFPLISGKTHVLKWELTTKYPLVALFPPTLFFPWLSQPRMFLLQSSKGTTHRWADTQVDIILNSLKMVLLHVKEWLVTGTAYSPSLACEEWQHQGEKASIFWFWSIFPVHLAWVFCLQGSSTRFQVQQQAKVLWALAEQSVPICIHPQHLTLSKIIFKACWSPKSCSYLQCQEWGQAAALGY